MGNEKSKISTLSLSICDGFLVARHLWPGEVTDVSGICHLG